MSGDQDLSMLFPPEEFTVRYEGEEFKVSVKFLSTAGAIKEEIKNLKNISVARQTLMFDHNGSVLDDNSVVKVEDCNSILRLQISDDGNPPKKLKTTASSSSSSSAPPAEQILYLQAMTSSSIVVHIGMDKTVMDLKKSIAAKEGVGAECVTVSSEGVVLEDSKILGDLSMAVKMRLKTQIVKHNMKITVSYISKNTTDVPTIFNMDVEANDRLFDFIKKIEYKAKEKDGFTFPKEFYFMCGDAGESIMVEGKTLACQNVVDGSLILMYEGKPHGQVLFPKPLYFVYSTMLPPYVLLQFKRILYVNLFIITSTIMHEFFHDQVYLRLRSNL